MTTAAADEEDKPTRHHHRFGGKRSMAGLLNLARHFGRRASRRKSSLLFLFFTSLLVVPVILYIVLAYMVAGDPRLLPLAIRNARSVLLVVAHPDDECLFFGPSILNVWAEDRSVGRALLVLSSGLFFLSLSSFLSLKNNYQATTMVSAKSAERRSKRAVIRWGYLPTDVLSWNTAICRTTPRNGGRKPSSKVCSRNTWIRGTLTW
jgi:hypothetical protein